MTDPADMDGAALGEAVMRAMNWVPANPEIPQGDWLTPMDDGLRHVRALDFTGREKWAAFGEVLAECERRGWEFSMEFGTLTLWSADRHWHEDADTTADWPRVFAITFLRAVAGEGRA